MTTINSVSTFFFNTSHSKLIWVLASENKGNLKAISSKISGLEALSFPFKTHKDNITIIQNSTNYAIDLTPFIASKIHITSLIFKCQQAKITLASLPPENPNVNLDFKIEDPRILELMPEDYSFALLDNKSSLEYQCSMLKIVDVTCFSKLNPIQAHIGHLSFDNYLEETYREIGAFKKEDALDGKSMTLTGKRKDLCSPTNPVRTVLKSNSPYFLLIHSITKFPTSISFSIQDNLGTISKVTFAPSGFSNPNGITFQIMVPEVVAGNSTLILELDSQKYTFPVRICSQSDINTYWHQTFTKYQNIFATTQKTPSNESDIHVPQSLLEEPSKRKNKDDIQQATIEETKHEETETSAKKSRKKQGATQKHPLFGASQLSTNSKEIIDLTNEEENHTATTTLTETNESTFEENAFTTTPSNASQQNDLNITTLSSSKEEDLEQLFPGISSYIDPNTK